MAEAENNVRHAEQVRMYGIKVVMTFRCLPVHG
jgi:hypothetical protein